MIPAPIRRLSYNPTVRTIAQRLRVGGIARRVYCRLLSGSGALQVSCLGVNAVFRAHNNKQLAFLDCVFTTERSAIEATLCKLNRGDVFLDVGCHYGIYSVLASKLVGPEGRIIAVEPHPGIVEGLRENVALNGCQNVEVLSLPFSDRTGSLVLAYSENCSYCQRQSDPMSTLHSVQATTGDEALRNSPVPTVVKVDVEGHEFAVLSGLKQTLSSADCRTLCVEIHPQLLPSDITEESIMTFIRNCGFNVVVEIARPPEVHVVATREQSLREP